MEVNIYIILVFCIIAIILIIGWINAQQEKEQLTLILEKEKGEREKALKDLASLRNENKSISQEKTKLENEVFTKKTDYERVLTEKLKIENTAFRFKLNSHSLKNNIQLLSNLSERMNQSIILLTDILIYIIYDCDDEYVSLKKEIEFLDNYIKYNKKIYDLRDNIVCPDYNAIIKGYEDKKIPPFFIASLIENAFEHGDKKHKEFLKIEIDINESFFELKIVNKISHTRLKTKGGVGLNKLQNRLISVGLNSDSIKFECNETNYSSSLKIPLKQ